MSNDDNENNEYDNLISSFLCNNNNNYTEEIKNLEFNLDDYMYIYLLETPGSRDNKFLNAQVKANVNRFPIKINNMEINEKLNKNKKYSIFLEKIKHLSAPIQNNIKLCINQAFLGDSFNYTILKYHKLMGIFMRCIINYNPKYLFTITDENINLQILDEKKYNNIYDDSNIFIFNYICNIDFLQKKINMSFIFNWNNKYNYFKKLLYLIETKKNLYSYKNNFNEILLDNIIEKIFVKIFDEDYDNTSDIKFNCIKYYNYLSKINWNNDLNSLKQYILFDNIKNTNREKNFIINSNTQSPSFSYFLFVYLKKYIKDFTQYKNLQIIFHNINNKSKFNTLNSKLLQDLSRIKIFINDPKLNNFKNLQKLTINKIINKTNELSKIEHLAINHQEILNQINNLDPNLNNVIKLKFILWQQGFSLFTANIFNKEFCIKKFDIQGFGIDKLVDNNIAIINNTNNKLIINRIIGLRLKYLTFTFCEIITYYYIDLTNDKIISKNNIKWKSTNIKKLIYFFIKNINDDNILREARAIIPCFVYRSENNLFGLKPPPESTKIFLDIFESNKKNSNKSENELQKELENINDLCQQYLIKKSVNRISDETVPESFSVKYFCSKMLSSCFHH